MADQEVTEHGVEPVHFEAAADIAFAPSISTGLARSIASDRDHAAGLNAGRWISTGLARSIASDGLEPQLSFTMLSRADPFPEDEYLLKRIGTKYSFNIRYQQAQHEIGTWIRRETRSPPAMELSAFWLSGREDLELFKEFFGFQEEVRLTQSGIAKVFLGIQQFHALLLKMDAGIVGDIGRKSPVV